MALAATSDRTKYDKLFFIALMVVLLAASAAA